MHFAGKDSNVKYKIQMQALAWRNTKTKIYTKTLLMLYMTVTNIYAWLDGNKLLLGFVQKSTENNMASEERL